MNTSSGEREGGAMSCEHVNRASTIGLVVLSLTALLAVLLGALDALLSGQVPSPGRDEGAGARIFQMLIVALGPTGLLFFATADWTRPWRSVRRLVLPAAAVVVAFGILYYFEHDR